MEVIVYMNTGTIAKTTVVDLSGHTKGPIHLLIQEEDFAIDKTAPINARTVLNNGRVFLENPAAGSVALRSAYSVMFGDQMKTNTIVLRVLLAHESGGILG